MPPRNFFLFFLLSLLTLFSLSRVVLSSMLMTKRIQVENNAFVMKLYNYLLLVSFPLFKKAFVVITDQVCIYPSRFLSRMTDRHQREDKRGKERNLTGQRECNGDHDHWCCNDWGAPFILSLPLSFIPCCCLLSLFLFCFILLLLWWIRWGERSRQEPLLESNCQERIKMMAGEDEDHHHPIMKSIFPFVCSFTVVWWSYSKKEEERQGITRERKGTRKGSKVTMKTDRESKLMIAGKAMIVKQRIRKKKSKRPSRE